MKIVQLYQPKVLLFLLLIISPTLMAKTIPEKHTAGESLPVVANDPYESFNRSMFQFNDFFDRILLKPIAVIYKTIIPKPLRMGVSNFFSNIDSLPTIANDILQGKFQQGANDAWRFGINSTIGLAGFIDVASQIQLKKHHEDFGWTLAHWGYTQSNYLVLPFFGPSTIRDTIGTPIDYYGFSVYPHIHPDRYRYLVYGIGVIDHRAELLEYQGVYEQAALDRYVFVRDAYLQYRNNHAVRADEATI